MNFNYTAVNEKGEKQNGVVEAINRDTAISAVQKRGFIVLTVVSADKPKSLLDITIFEKIPVKDVVIMSRQISTLFEAQVSALKTFSLIASNSQNKLMKKKLEIIVSDLQSGFSISQALAKHPMIFSDFYVNMVKSGEESGKLTQTFAYLADYLDRQYALAAKTKNALIYPAFVIGIFVIVMVLMFVMIIPKLSAIIKESGQEIPLNTRIVMGISELMVNYGLYLLIAVGALGVVGAYFIKSKKGKLFVDQLKLKTPVFGPLFTKVYLARIADNMDTMLSSGIPIVRAIEITAGVVGNRTYQEILSSSCEKVKSGNSFSEALSSHKEIPQILVQMIKVGEETGAMGNILKTLAKFYKREVDDAVDTLVGLIEPVMIVALGLGVGLLLTSVLMPIYNIAGGVN
jgi:type IV pilus assembly protein PilC